MGFHVSVHETVKEGQKDGILPSLSWSNVLHWIAPIQSYHLTS